MSHGTRTLVVSATALDDRSSLLLLAGASGFLIIEDASMAAVSWPYGRSRQARTRLHPTVVHAVLEARARASPRARCPNARCRSVPRTASSPPESATCLAGLRDGLTTRQLAARLGVAEKTVETHRSRLYAKLGARNQAHAIRIANDRSSSAAD